MGYEMEQIINNPTWWSLSLVFIVGIAVTIIIDYLTHSISSAVIMILFIASFALCILMSVIMGIEKLCNSYVITNVLNSLPVSSGLGIHISMIVVAMFIGALICRFTFLEK